MAIIQKALPHLKSAQSDGAAKEDQPVFLSGFPRSGISLMDRILAGHPVVQTLNEKPATYLLARDVFDHLEQPEDIDREAVRKTYYKRMEGHIVKPDYQCLVNCFPMSMLYFGLYNHIFPDSKYVLVARHPLDCLLSSLKQNFMPNPVGIHMHRLEDAAKLYTKSMDLVFETQHRLGLDMHIMRYEDLIAKPEKTLQDLLEFLGLDWHPAVLEHHKSSDPGGIKTASYAQVIRPLYKDAAYHWRHYEVHLKPVMPLVAPYLEKFGYDS